MLTKSIKIKNFAKSKVKVSLKLKIKKILSDDSELLKSLSRSYEDKYKIKSIKKIIGKNKIRLIGMGGSILGAQAIYNFLNKKVKKKFFFVNNLISKRKISHQDKFTNLIISKSGNTLETITNANILIKNKQKNIFITENKPSYLYNLAHKLKSEIIHHNNYIGGRYSVLSEVGMLPAELMGLNPQKFRQLDNLIKNQKFINLLIENTSSILNYVKEKKFNSIIINYDHSSNYLFQWYQQLVAESLGKKGKGILPVISEMPKDNHSLMQFYLDGIKKNFFTFFAYKEKSTDTDKIEKKKLFNSHKFLGSRNINEIMLGQKKATEKVFSRKKIPYRSFEINNKDEKTLGELFCYFILETILLGRALNVNPFDEPSVDLIKKETRKFFSYK
tara:strand:- start:1055 stop:2221 length:1167 start_codon:yes stop_codon:yes gene_type:complete